MWFFSRPVARAESLFPENSIGRKQRRRVLKFESLKDRRLLTSDSFDLIGATKYFNDPAFSQYDGRNYAIAILDTGADLDHPDFGPDNEAPFGVADRIKFHHDFANDDTNASDDHGNGTHHASTIAKLAPGVDLIILKVLNSDGVLNAVPPEVQISPIQ
jgi:subtilisin family serine protease